MSTLDTVKELVSQLTDKPAAELTAETKFGDDLGLDSLTGLQLLFDCELKFQLVLDDVDGKTIPTDIGGLVVLIDHHLAAPRTITA